MIISNIEIACHFSSSTAMTNLLTCKIMATTIKKKGNQNHKQTHKLVTDKNN